MTRRCANCRYFYTESGISSCRGTPPKVEMNEAGLRTYFPQPSPRMWCGFHKLAVWRAIKAMFGRNGA